MNIFDQILFVERSLDTLGFSTSDGNNLLVSDHHGISSEYKLYWYHHNCGINNIKDGITFDTFKLFVEYNPRVVYLGTKNIDSDRYTLYTDFHFNGKKTDNVSRKIWSVFVRYIMR